MDSGRYSYWWVFWSGQFPAKILSYTACFLSGWIVARFHPGQAVAMVSVSALILPASMAIGRPVCILAGGLWAVRSHRDPLLRVSPR